MKFRINKGESIVVITNELKNRSELQKYNNPDKGAFNLIDGRVEWSKKVSRPVIQICPETKKHIKKHSSLYQAAKAIGIPNGFGNIKTNGITRNGIAYGFLWKFLEPNE